MNRRISVVFALSMLLAAVPAHAVRNRQDNWSMNEGSNSRPNSKKLITLGGAAVLGTAIYFIGKRFTSTGRFNRAVEIVEDLKAEYSRLFSDSKATQDQIFAELGAFENTLKKSRNFSQVNVIEALDYVAGKLKKAESLLVAAKRGNGPQLCEKYSVKAQQLYAQIYASIMKTEAAKVEEPKNHLELEKQIDALLIEVRAMQNKVARIYGDIELSPTFKQQLKEYEELRAQRTANTRSAVINFAIPTVTVVGSLVALGLAAGKIVSWFVPTENHVSRVDLFQAGNAMEARFDRNFQEIRGRVDGLYNNLANRRQADEMNASFQESMRRQGINPVPQEL